MRKPLSLLALVVLGTSAVACAAPAGSSAEDGDPEVTGSARQAFDGVLTPRTPVPRPIPTLVPPPPPAPFQPFAFVGGYAGWPGLSGHADGSVQTSFVRPTQIATTAKGETWVLDEDPVILQSRLRIVFDTYGQNSPHVQTVLTTSQSLWDLGQIRGMAVDPQSLDLFVTYGAANQIYRITLGGVSTRFAGDVPPFLGASSAGLADGPRLSAQFNAPSGIVLDGQGNFCVADTGNSAIRILDALGTVRTMPLSGAPAGFAPTSLARDARNGTLYTLSKSALYAITASGQVSLFAGIPDDLASFAGEPRFNAPQGLAVDRSGNVYVSDTGNHVIKKVVVNWGTTALRIETVSNLRDTPTNPVGYGGYGPADPVMITPSGLSFWGDTLLFTDADRHTVRRLI